MTPESRRLRVDELFNKIALIAQAYENNPKLRDELIKPMVAELWAITQQQEKLGETPNQIYWANKSDTSVKG